MIPTKKILILINALILYAPVLLGSTLENSVPTITIWIHGTKPTLPDYFYKKGEYFFIKGLKSVKKYCPKHGPNNIINGLVKSGYIDYDHLYFYGWPGKLNAKNRLKSAQILRTQLEHLISLYPQRPAIRIITHSHGGNVALYLVHELERFQSSIVIDELILLAMPVQAWTESYVDSPHVSKIYHFYSENDWTQVVDPQGLQIFLNNDSVPQKPHIFEHSKRTFDYHDKVTQIQVKINNDDPWHITFMDYYPPLPVFKHLPNMHPHRFPRFLPELKNIMEKIKTDDIQALIKTYKKPLTVSINTQVTKKDRITITPNHLS